MGKLAGTARSVDPPAAGGTFSSFPNQKNSAETSTRTRSESVEIDAKASDDFNCARSELGMPIPTLARCDLSLATSVKEMTELGRSDAPI